MELNGIVYMRMDGANKVAISCVIGLITMLIFYIHLNNK